MEEFRTEPIEIPLAVWKHLPHDRPCTCKDLYLAMLRAAQEAPCQDTSDDPPALF